MSETISINKYVELIYRIVDQSNGEVIEQVEDPLGYVHGDNTLLFNQVTKELEVKCVGDAVAILLTAKDAFGHAQLGGVAPTIAALVKDKLGYKYHWAVSDYLHRSARHIASTTDVNQAYALVTAADAFALSGKTAVMPIIVRTSDSPYKWKMGEAKLAKVANVEKFMPKSFISKDGFGITAKARKYLSPLIAGEDHPVYKNAGTVVQTTYAKNKLIGTIKN